MTRLSKWMCSLLGHRLRVSFAIDGWCIDTNFKIDDPGAEFMAMAFDATSFSAACTRCGLELAHEPREPRRRVERVSLVPAPQGDHAEPVTGNADGVLEGAGCRLHGDLDGPCPVEVGEDAEGA